MSLITTEINLDYLITPLSLQFGDVDLSQYSEAVYRTALVSGVKYLQRKWNNKYLIDDDNNVARNTALVYEDDSPPIIQQQDEQGILLAAIIILRQLKLGGSSSTFSNWSTPDLSYSNVSSSRVLLDLWKQAIDDLELWLKGKPGTPKKTFFYTVDGQYPINT